MPNTINIIEKNYVDVSFELEKHHELFYRFWQLGEPIFREDIPTACVGYDDTNENVIYYFNKDFYDSLTLNELTFVVAHECLHIVLNHCTRFKDGIPELRDIMNIAMDVVVNELLISGFNFDKSDTPKLFDDNGEESQACWLDNSFKDKDGNARTDIESNREVEYYYNILKENIKLTIMQINSGDIPKSGNIDSHGDYSELDDSQIEKVSSKLGQVLSNDAKKSLKSSECSGSMVGNIAGKIKAVSNAKTKIKPKWETVIKKWAKKAIVLNSENSQWARISRRMLSINTDMFIPSDMEEEGFKKGKMDLWFFQDTSGSCYHVRDRFFAAARSLPPDKFNIRMFCFDTQVYETTLKSGELFGFGGTLFDILEDAIQNKIRTEKIKYPKAIFVITDGYSSDIIYPQYPKRWYWFLSENHKGCIPSESNTYMLKDFE